MLLVKRRTKKEIPQSPFAIFPKMWSKGSWLRVTGELVPNEEPGAPLLYLGSLRWPMGILLSKSLLKWLVCIPAWKDHCLLSARTALRIKVLVLKSFD